MSTQNVGPTKTGQDTFPNNAGKQTRDWKVNLGVFQLKCVQHMPTSTTTNDGGETDGHYIHPRRNADGRTHTHTSTSPLEEKGETRKISLWFSVEKLRFAVIDAIILDRKCSFIFWHFGWVVNLCNSIISSAFLQLKFQCENETIIIVN